MGGIHAAGLESPQYCKKVLSSRCPSQHTHTSFYSKALPMAILIVCHSALINPKIGLYAFELIINIPKLIYLESYRVKG